MNNTHNDNTNQRNVATQGALVPTRVPYAAHEMIVRRCDGKGNTLPQAHAYTTQLVEDIPLEATPYVGALTLLRQMDPLKANTLHGRWETELRAALRTIQRVRQEEEEALARRNRRAVEENARIDAEQQAQFAACKDALQPHQALREALIKKLAEAHATAAVAVTRAGGSYDPNNPSEAGVLRITSRTLPVIAGDLGLPFLEADKLSHMHPLIANIATVGFGTLFGLSLGLILGFIHAGSLLRHPFALVLFLGLGALWACLSRAYLCATAERASSRYYLGNGPRSWGPYLAVTVIVLLLTLGFDAAVGQAGVLGLAHAQATAHSLGGDTEGAGRGGASLLVALAFALPYAGYAVWEGYLKGMYTPVINRLKNRQDAEVRLIDAQRRSEPQIQEALNRIADVKDGLRQQAEHETHMRDVAGPYMAKNQALEQQRLPVSDGLDEAAQQRVDQAIHQARGVQEEWNRDFSQAIGTNSPTSKR